MSTSGNHRDSARLLSEEIGKRRGGKKGILVDSPKWYTMEDETLSAAVIFTGETEEGNQATGDWTGCADCRQFCYANLTGLYGLPWRERVLSEHHREVLCGRSKVFALPP